MREFFRGWRRTVGWFTLAMVCMLMAAWLRSQIRHDVIGIQVGARRQMIHLTNGGICWWGVSTLTRQRFVWQSFAAQSVPSIDDERNDWRDDEGWAWRLREWRVSYLLVASPLTLLSAYLILWKPRKLV